MSTLLEAEGKVDFPWDEVEDEETDILSQLPGPVQQYIEEKIREGIQDALTQIIAIIYDSRDYRLKIATVVCAFGLPLFLGQSLKEIAKLHGVTKQALSKSIKQFQADFDLPLTRGQKSLEACESYRKSAIRRHHDV